MIYRLIILARVLAACYIFRLVVHIIELVRLDFKVCSLRKSQEKHLSQTHKFLAEEDAKADEEWWLETFYCERCYQFSQIGPVCEWCHADRPTHPLFLTLTLEEHSMQYRFPPATDRSKR